jgi:polyisoprenoid-binding protein YceI
MKRVLIVAAGVLGLLVAGGVFLALRGGDAPPPPRLEGAGTVVAAGERWRVGEGSFAGYRVDEEYLGVGVNTAVGRTRAVTGTVHLDGATVVSAELEADLTLLRSDEAQRDDALRTRGIETGRYPRASFTLEDPLPLSATDRATTGTLTLHGRSAPITVSVAGSLEADRLELVGRARIDFADFGIEPPSVAGLVTVRDTGTLEFRLIATAA